MNSQTRFKIALKDIITTFLIKAIYHEIGLSIILNDTVNKILPVVQQTSLNFKLHDLKF